MTLELPQSDSRSKFNWFERFRLGGHHCCGTNEEGDPLRGRQDFTLQRHPSPVMSWEVGFLAYLHK